MESIAPFITYSITLAIAAAIPGPGIAALVGHALGGSVNDHKLSSSSFFLLGMGLGDIFYLTIAVIGLATIAQTFAQAFVVIKYLGAAYLLYLAYIFWTSDVEITKAKGQKPQSNFAATLGGFMVTLGNPKTIIFYLALLPTVLDLAHVTTIDWMILTIITFVVLFATLLPYFFLATKAREMLTQPKSLKHLNRFAAVFIGGAGAFILSETTYWLFKRA
jgi:threonine/homoserine/homoserine lactone efflux protein